MKNVSIVGKFLLVMAVFGVFALGSAAFSIAKMMQIDRGYSSALSHGVAVALAMSQADTAMTVMRGAAGEVQLAATEADNAAALGAFKRAREGFLAAIGQAEQADSGSASAIAAIRERVLHHVDVVCQEAIKAGAAATDAAAVAASQALHLKSCAPGFVALSTDLAGVVDDQKKIVQSKAADLADSTRRTVMQTAGIILAGLVAVMVGGFVLLRAWVSKPLIGLSGMMARLAAGDLAAEVSGAERKDEIGAMSRAVQVLKEAAIDKERLERQTEIVRQTAEQERVRAEETRQLLVEQQTSVVRTLAESLGRLAAGDLTCDMGDEFAPEYEGLRMDFNAAVGELRGLISTIVASTGTIRSGTGEISQASDDLSRRTEQQAASLEQTAAALDQITATVRKTAAGATAAQEVASTAKTEAEHGEAVVNDAVNAMSEIEKSASEIGQIIGVIDEIAFQTNLLALNAGVEAARAGDAGRGFAVVASEVRALAQRSAQAAKEIKALIGTSSAHVGRGVTLVHETGSALSRILNQVTQITRTVTEIAASAHEQASGLAQVNTAVNQMDQVTQQNAAMVEQSTAASHSLAADTAELERLTARFKTGVDAPVPQPPRPREKPPVRKAKPRSGAAPVQLVHAEGNTLRKPAVDEEGWKEF